MIKLKILIFSINYMISITFALSVSGFQVPLALHESVDQIQDKRNAIPMDTQEYYQRYENALKQLQKKGALTVQTPSINQRDMNTLTSYINNIYTENNFEDNIDTITNSNSQNNYDDLSLIDILQESQTKPLLQDTIIDIPITQTPESFLSNDPNQYAEIPYIPAIHGTNENNQHLTVGGISSILGITSVNNLANSASIAEDEGLPSNATRIFGTSLTNCAGQTLCSIGLAILATFGTVGAFAIPLLFATKKRRRRNSDPIMFLPREDIHDLIDDYEQIINNDEDILMNGSLRKVIDGALNTLHSSEDLRKHQERANMISKRIGQFASDESNNNKESKGNNDPILSDIEEDNITNEKIKARNDDYLNSFLFMNPPILEEEQLNSNPKVLPDSQSLQAENKTPDEVHDLFSQNFNINSPVKRNYPKSDVTGQNNAKNTRKSEGQSLSYGTLKTMTTSQLINQLLFTENQVQINSVKPPQLPAQPDKERVNTLNSNDKLLMRLEQLLQRHQNPKPSPSVNHQYLNNLLQLAIIDRNAKIPTAPSTNRPTISPDKMFFVQSAIKHQAPVDYSIIPMKTFQNILQNPPFRQQNLNSILSKLPQLVMGTVKHSEAHPSFASTIIHSPQLPVLVSDPVPDHFAEMRPSISADQQIPNKPQDDNSSSSTSLSPEVQKFYGLLCKAILEPDIPLNRVTAYIAEKCLVMKFTGIIKPS